MRDIVKICLEHGIEVDNNTNFKDFIKKIYYDFDRQTLQELMNDIMSEEVQHGERIFD